MASNLLAFKPGCDSVKNNTLVTIFILLGWQAGRLAGRLTGWLAARDMVAYEIRFQNRLLPFPSQLMPFRTVSVTVPLLPKFPVGETLKPTTSRGGGVGEP